jgi:general L-amino acid transport system substrate-binding protein
MGKPALFGHILVTMALACASSTPVGVLGSGRSRVVFAMINAKELDASSHTIGRAILSAEPAIERLVGIEVNFGEQAELTKDWVVQIVRQAGNYGEVFERSIGTATRLGIPRGLDHLCRRYTLHTPPPGTKQRM